MGDAPEQQQPESGAEQKPKSKMMLIIIVFVVLLGVIIGGAYMFLGKSKEGEQMINTAKKSEEPGYMYSFPDPFVGNLAPPDDEYIYTANITLEIKPKTDIAEADALKEMAIGESDNPKNMMPYIKQIIQNELDSKTRVEINSSDARDKIRLNIRNEINSILTKGRIVNVFMKVFVN